MAITTKGGQGKGKNFILQACLAVQIQVGRLYFLLKKRYQHFLKVLKVHAGFPCLKRNHQNGLVSDNSVVKKSDLYSYNPNVERLQKLERSFSPLHDQQHFLLALNKSNRNIHAIADKSPSVYEKLRQFGLKQQCTAKAMERNPDTKLSQERDSFSLSGGLPYSDTIL